ncbi:MAG: hypothetical protein M1820_005486 [Bogoriella megaspora]|nr:MAG: hypothetical protein M1820_005486 [Bogoriella megaspora]
MANMIKALTSVAPLRPEIRLQQAVAQFESALTNEQKDAFRVQKSQSERASPDYFNVLRLVAEIDSKSQKRSRRCFGPRFTNFLHAIQRFALVGDVTIGGSQNLIACGVAVVAHGTYLEKVSNFIMQVGRSAPLYQKMALLYSHSKSLQASLAEYHIVVVQLCHHLLALTKNSPLRAFVSTLDESELSSDRAKLEQWAKIIKDEVDLLRTRDLKEITRMQKYFARDRDFYLRERKLDNKLKVQNSCSTYNHETTWIQTRKLGNATFYCGLDEYEKWKRKPESSALLCAGKLGSGKSVTLANIVDDLRMSIRDKATTVAFFFCRHDIQESLRAQTVIGSLARQLFQPFSELEGAAAYLNQNPPNPDIHNLLELLSKFLPHNSEAYFILDGLDECETSEKKALMQYLCKLEKHFTFHLCISLRLEPGNLDTLDAQQQNFMDTETILIPDDNPEIAQFVESELESRIESGTLKLGNPAMSLQIYDALVEKSQGMFLWAVLQLDSIYMLRTDEAIRYALDNLPRNLPETFSRILRLSRNNDNDAKLEQRRILELIIAARRPLTTKEFREALSVVPGDTTWRPDRLLNDVTSVLACCGSLIIVDEEELTVRFGHNSIKQFLLSGDQQMIGFDCSMDSANETMVDIIATYLNYGVFGTELIRNATPHVSLASAPSQVINVAMQSSSYPRTLALKILRSRKTPEFDIGKTLASINLANKSNDFRFHAYATHFLLPHLLTISQTSPINHELLVKCFRAGLTHGFETLEGRHGIYMWAAKQGRTSIVKAVLDTGKVAINVRDSIGRTPLSLAAAKGHDAVFQQLLTIDRVDINSQDFEGRTPLSLAAAGGHDAVIRQLLTITIKIGHDAVIQQLLTTGRVDVNLRDEEYHTPLLWAAKRGNSALVQQLLATGKADVNMKDSGHKTALLWAAETGNESIVQQLLATGKTDINACDLNELTALLLAAWGGGTTLSWTALLLAVQGGHESIVQQLLATDKIDVNVKDCVGRTPLSSASVNGNEAVVRQLLAVDKVDLNSKDTNGKTALSNAAAEGHEAIVQLLKSAGGIE